ncbi:Os08g0186601 [Oryza sativa Japonica Group]|uniref:Uncharacterized protein n=2 Tax=Oryza sativa subsp. japonica TaxID=39947 RepID=A0A0P0XCQ8_ORYSJ|nr:hypothetical protein [Oryza sativa Japonica Group]BAD03316.1 hypothetical protein [Oryza sativa Japonica Group]BAT04135.1 Os08g0186601 [Oryza sativa Japonica Group]
MVGVDPNALSMSPARGEGTSAMICRSSARFAVAPCRSCRMLQRQLVGGGDDAHVRQLVGTTTTTRWLDGRGDYDMKRCPEVVAAIGIADRCAGGLHMQAHLNTSCRVETIGKEAAGRRLERGSQR